MKIYSYLLMGLALSSCVDTVILPDNKIVDEDYWKKKSEVDAVVTTAYAQLCNQNVIRNMIVWGDFRSDELVMNAAIPSSNADKIALAQIFSMNIETSNTFTSWAPFYSAINYCNLVLQKAEGVIKEDPDYMQEDYNTTRSQVLALRAYCYFYLTRVFHDIPVTPAAYLNSSDDLNAPQAAPDSVLTMCINDLQEALNYAVPGDVYGDWRDKGFLNEDGINALLADIYLWRASVNRSASDYQACVDHCDNVIAAKKQAYEASAKKRPLHRGDDDVEQPYYLAEYDEMYESLFGLQGQNADESIFELQFKTSNTNNAGLNQMYYSYGGTTTNGYLQASNVFGTVKSSGTGVWINGVDQRLIEYMYDANNDTYEQFGVRKFTGNYSVGSSAESNPSSHTNSMTRNWIVYRLTDVMLMKAEALVQLYELGDKDEDDPRLNEAFELCKFVNDRALPDDYKSTNAIKASTYREKMEDLVLTERARELCFEGKRWFDLMRYNYRHTQTKADLTKKLTQGYVANSSEFFELALRKYPSPAAMRAKMRDERYLYMPINQDEIELNPNLQQNPVYKVTAKY